MRACASLLFGILKLIIIWNNNFEIKESLFLKMKAEDYYNKDYNIDSKEGSTKKPEEEEKDESTSIL